MMGVKSADALFLALVNTSASGHEKGGGGVDDSKPGRKDAFLTALVRKRGPPP